MSEAHVLRIPIKPGMRARVLSYLEKRAKAQDELREIYQRRGIAETFMFVDTREGVDTLFVHRRGRNLQAAGADFLRAGAPLEEEFMRVLLDATDLDGARTLPIVFRWPPVG